MEKIVREKRIPLVPIQIKKMCECGGEIEFTGKCLTSYPAKYEHACKSCGYVCYFEQSYPTIEYEVKNIFNVFHQ